MMDEYERYEAESNKIKKKNKQTMREFHEWLKVKEYTAKTINVHIRNIDFYINVFLIYYDICKPEDGAHKIDSFLGYWFIHKAMWATVSSIKTYGTSFKYFYTFLHEKGLIDEDKLIDLKRVIKETMPEWLQALDRYDNFEEYEDEDEDEG